MIQRIAASRDNCGCGMIANFKNIPSHELTIKAVEGLSRMMHRGAVASDGKSGDGAGFLFSMPQKFMKRIAEFNGYDLPEVFGVAMLFITKEEHKEVFSRYCANNDLKVLFYRDVPVNTEVIGTMAKKTMPKIQQAFVVPNSLMSTRRFEPLMYLTRKEVGHHLIGEDFYIASFSSKSITYKGLVMPTFMRDFYLDLQEKDFEVSYAIFHQRFSTNTLPKWKLAQPFRTLAHNGEINSIEANRFNAKIKTEAILNDSNASEVFSDQELKRLMPILAVGQSDSASVDNMFEFLINTGMDFFQAARAMVPPPWQNAPNIDSKLRVFYEYLSSNFEAWDGPAALNMTDGRYLCSILDRNGLRPAKYVITRDDTILISSEYGINDINEEEVVEQGKLTSGQMLGIDLKEGTIYKVGQINDYLKERQPWSKWVNENSAYLMEHADKNFSDFEDFQVDNLVEMQRYHNYTNEIVEGVIAPMSDLGKEEVGSMGDDTPLACFSQVQRNFTDFFRQKFAQVTNPPIDPLREKLVMATSITFGEKNNVLKDGHRNGRRLKATNPLLSKEKLDVLKSFGNPENPLFDPSYRAKVFYSCFKSDLRKSLHNLGKQVEKEVRENQVRIVILDDRCLNQENKLIPMPLAIGYINNYLLKVGLRSKVSIVVCSGEVFDSHSYAVLLAFGATAIYPYLLYATALKRGERKKHATQLEKKRSISKTHKALNLGLLKIMSKMGICTVESYQNSALFDVIGLSAEIMSECFPHAEGLLQGLGYEDLEFRIAKAHKIAYKKQLIAMTYPLEVGSFYKYMNDGEYHDYSPDVVKGIHSIARRNNPEDYRQFANRVNNRGLRMIRDFLEFKPDRESISIEEVEPKEALFRRFSSAAMSLGSISPEAHEAIAEAMNTIGGQSNSGEGGEDSKRFGTVKNSKIKQIASGRFGVKPYYLRSAEELQIKVAQGAKPGEGGQLPGTKVTPLIATLRCTIPGVTLISPPPHHDIYSIEDLAQLIYDLKQVNPTAVISVKLVSSSGVGTIAVGVAKAYADKIIISGADGGTGAAQLNSIKFAGNPWELGLSEAHNALKANDLRHLVELQTDGGLKTGMDIVKAAILGAESFGFGTALLTTVGCKILRVCHLNKCSVGIATQSDMLRAYYVGTVTGIINYITSVVEEARTILAQLGYNSMQDIIGKTHLLSVVNDESAKRFDFSDVLYNYEGKNFKMVDANEPWDKNLFEKEVFKEVLPVIKAPQFPKVIERTIVNTNRSFGAYISGHIASFYGDKGLPKETISIQLKGVAGQSLGAYLSNGMLIRLTGTANDYVGKGMAGGHIIIVPKNYREDNPFSLAGNTCLYGATGGKLFIAGTVGERFAVRNSGTLAVVEGTGDHPCEYMTGGTVVILGETGHNFGAGMTGGVAFVYDRNQRFVDKMNQELIKAERIDTDEADEARHYLRKILRSYHYRTGSQKAQFILENFREASRYFYLVTSKDMKAPLNPMEGN